MTDHTNHGTDIYGRSPEKSPNVGIGYRKEKVNDFNYKWEGKEKDAPIFFGRLADTGLGYIHVSEYEAWATRLLVKKGLL